MNYYIADCHFNHANIINFDGRPFKTVQEMDEHMIKQWNSVVTNDDDVYVLGDFTFEKDVNVYSKLLSRLFGRKHLILGNHDKRIPKEEWDTVSSKWDSIQDYLEVKDSGKTLMLSHYPILFYKQSYKEQHWMLHGHTHNNKGSESANLTLFVKQLRDSYVPEDHRNRGQIINVGTMLDYVNYTPQTFNQLLKSFNKEHKPLAY